ncbi:MAG TPA: GWxTD domain-containing protein [Gemmatimonadaceae bacterium]|nr:GWxTD domain-containing protein [Gemmatimonadaceae bacterium]
MFAHAQHVRGADALTRSQVSDSQAVLAELDARVRANPDDASAWFHRGMVAWALATRGRAPDPPKGLDATKLGRLADTSLRLAVIKAPDNALYRLTTGRFLLASGVSMTRGAAGEFFESALKLSRTQGTPRQHAETAIELARMSWRRYEALANRRMTIGVGDIGRSLSDAMNPIAKGAWILEEVAERERRDEAVRSLLQRSGLGTGIAGGSAWETAAQAAQSVAAVAGGSLSRAATSQDAAQLTSAGAQAAVGALAAADAIATTVMSTDKHGLALQSTSLKDVRDFIESHSQPLPLSVTGANYFARADTLFTEAYRADATAPFAFRSVAMMLAEKNLWSGLEMFARSHIAKHPNDGIARMSLGLALQRQAQSNDAIAAFDAGLAKLEYDERIRLDNVARIIGPARARRVDRGDPDVLDVFQKMFWMTYDQMWADGRNESRGEILARVTFAELRWTVEELDLKGADTDRGDVHVRYGPPDVVAVIGPNVAESAADVMTFWLYDSGLMFAFTSLTGYGTARIPNADRAMIDATKESQPVRFDNLARKRPDSLIVQTARFRAERDSIDLFVAASPPVREIRESMPVSGLARADVWLVAATAQIAYRDSLPLDSAGIRTWTARVKPGTYLFRVEASGVGATRGARSSALVELNDRFAMTGPGISDLLLASKVDAPAQTPARWRDLAMVPALGVIPRDARVDLVWENYDFASRAGSAEYSVSITIARQRSAAGAIVAAVTGALASVARIDTKPERVVIAFDRATSHANTLVDVVSLNLANTPAGTYTITLDVRDRVSGVSYTRASTVTIAK